MIINENMIILDLEAKDKESAILELAKQALKEDKITSVDDFAKSVFEREKTYTTGVGNGIAIPHGKSDAVKEAMIVFGKSSHGIEWESLDGKPVNIIFLLGVPDKNVSDIHLKILSQLSRKLMNDEFVERLKMADAKDDVLEALSDINIE
ncbi:MAG: fructose system component [Thermoanaerobacterium sp.]|jgi:PTS system, fructose subfamily, IIA component|uniref:PTS system fructose-specific IIA component n=1 Tax=Thermoanaerobacterium butyriciformans TaxID=1702242 RepID=A0ABS4NE27_9THEO|nr:MULTISPECIES: fructose PTS transporter subunit IIA [Thermoanaerobacterium]MDI3476665.1 fructose system component [Thermoanaerobacterium sp.]MBP2071924.1 PTS system fructose-specific IIA component [Thermoanaerobacterium butyriciformans]MCP2240170.1 PTS system fructose-specific IIA component [Thermoanaerobacterium thermosaccharolyticum]MDN5317086.1 fructose system component [Thermoanaerobacterium sp.]WHE07500.1 fructose PTS transporter subunit IIA [Thermoanaerobacterium thermosaccharolyticum]